MTNAIEVTKAWIREYGRDEAAKMVDTILKQAIANSEPESTIKSWKDARSYTGGTV